MDIIEIIEMIEETLDKAPTVPLSGQVLIDKEEILDYIQEMRLAYPDELKEAKWVKEERQRILNEAENKADILVKTAEEKQRQLVEENEIAKQAKDYANNLVNSAQTQAMEIKNDCNQYVDDLLGDAERRLEMLLKKVHDDRIHYNK